MRELATQESDFHTILRDVNERAWGDVGVVTSWLDQTYTFEENLDGNSHNRFHPELTTRRAQAVASARKLPVLQEPSDAMRRDPAFPDVPRAPSRPRSPDAQDAMSWWRC